MFPFSANLYRAFSESDVTILATDSRRKRATVCIETLSPGNRAVALVLLKDSLESFVLSNGMRYTPDGTVHPSDPTRPTSAAELCLTFDMEWVELGDRPHVYLFTFTAQEWESARQAMRHLLSLGWLSSDSYLEGCHTGQD